MVCWKFNNSIENYVVSFITQVTAISSKSFMLLQLSSFSNIFSTYQQSEPVKLESDHITLLKPTNEFHLPQRKNRTIFRKTCKASITPTTTCLVSELFYYFLCLFSSHENTSHDSSAGPLHLPLPLLGILFLQMFKCLVFSHILRFAQNLTLREAFLATLRSQLSCQHSSSPSPLYHFVLNMCNHLLYYIPQLLSCLWSVFFTRM